MKYFLIFSLISGPCFFANAQQEKSKDDPEKLKNVLFSYFDGIGKRDTKKMSRVTTRDFFLYEEGKAWTNDSVFSEMKRFPYARAYFNFNNFMVNVDESSGYMAYFENANFVMNDSTLVSLNFLGSATFKKVDGTWKMSFLHSDIRYEYKKTR